MSYLGGKGVLWGSEESEKGSEKGSKGVKRGLKGGGHIRVQKGSNRGQK